MAAGIALCVAVSACAAIPSPAQRRSHADRLATDAGWYALTLHARPFELVAYLRAAVRNDASLTVFIEGDGLAWIGDSGPSLDPTPREPVGLRMALAHPGGNAAYLARPCQFVDAEASGCPSRYWTTLRYSPEVIVAMGRAIDALMERFAAERLTLVGYSGGGAIAALVAARRDDVERLVTVAGNLDPPAWTKLHRIPALEGSLDPADEIDGLRGVRQWHVVGGRDGNVTPELVQGFASRFPEGQKPAVAVEEEFDHRCCWAQQWPRIWREALALREP